MFEIKNKEKYFITIFKGKIKRYNDIIYSLLTIYI